MRVGEVGREEGEAGADARPLPTECPHPADRAAQSETFVFVTFVKGFSIEIFCGREILQVIERNTSCFCPLSAFILQTALQNCFVSWIVHFSKVFIPSLIFVGGRNFLHNSESACLGINPLLRNYSVIIQQKKQIMFVITFQEKYVFLSFYQIWNR